MEDPPKLADDDLDESPQRKPLTAKQRAKLFSPKSGAWFGQLTRRSESHDPAEYQDAEKDVLVKKIQEKLAHSAVLAAEQFGLDIDSPKDRLWLLMLLAWSLYGGKPGGRPKKWNDEKYAQLTADISEARARRPDLDELSLCKMLAADPSKRNRYDNASARTLLRQLQEAKFRESRDGKTARVLADLTG